MLNLIKKNFLCKLGIHTSSRYGSIILEAEKNTPYIIYNTYQHQRRYERICNICDKQWFSIC